MACATLSSRSVDRPRSRALRAGEVARHAGLYRSWRTRSPTRRSSRLGTSDAAAPLCRSPIGAVERLRPGEWLRNGRLVAGAERGHAAPECHVRASARRSGTWPACPEAIRTRARGLYTAEAGTELLIHQPAWLHRSDFGDRFVHWDISITNDTEVATIDWPGSPGAITALASGEPPCSSGENRMLGSPQAWSTAYRWLCATPFSDWTITTTISAKRSSTRSGGDDWPRVDHRTRRPHRPQLLRTTDEPSAVSVSTTRSRRPEVSVFGHAVPDTDANEQNAADGHLEDTLGGRDPRVCGPRSRRCGPQPHVEEGLDMRRGVARTACHIRA